MKLRISAALFFLQLAACLSAADLPTAPPDELIHLYQQLRPLQGSNQGAIAENVEGKRDAATFTFIDGRLTSARPVAGHALAVWGLSPSRVLEKSTGRLVSRCGRKR